MKKNQRLVAFTLLELLVVIAIIAILIALAVPSLVSMAEGQGMKRAISSISDNLEVARSEAMAKSTWVLVGFADTTKNNAAQITVLSVASRDGTSSFLASNLMPISKPQHIDNVQILSNSVVTNTVPLGANSGGYVFNSTVAGQQLNFANQVIAFSPQGEAVINTNNTISPWVEVGVREMKGTTPVVDKTASIRVSGVSGQVLVTY